MRFQLNLYGIMTLCNFLCCSAILWILLQKNAKDRRTLSFSAFLLFICIWSFGLFLWQSVPDRDTAIQCYKIAVASAILIVSALVHFVHIILRIEKERKNTLFLIHGLNLFFTYCELFHFYEGFEDRFGFGLFPIVNPLFTVFLFWWVFQVIYVLYLVYAKGVKTKQGREKTTNKQLLLALSVGFSGGSTNWLLSYNIFIPPYLVIGVSIFAIWVGYIVFRHQLFDIEIIVKKTALFTGLFFLASIIVFGVTLLITPLLRQLGIPDIFSAIFSFALFILFFRPAEIYLENVTNRWLFQKRINYENLMHSLGDTLKKISALEPLCETLRGIMTDVLQIKYFLIYVYDSTHDVFVLKTPDAEFNSFPSQLSSRMSLIRFISQNDNILAYDYITSRALKNQLDALNAAVLVPLKSGNRLIGFALLGEKLSDKVFDNMDLRALRAMQASVATAIDNALTFEKLTLSQVELAQKEKLATVGVLAAGIKHEINNPLFVILGRAEMALHNQEMARWDAPTLLDYTQKQMSSIKYNADRIKDIVSRLSDFAKPIGQAEMKPASVRLALQDAIHLLAYDRAALSSVEFIMNDVAESLEVLADARMLVQIFFNLINNAIHAINFKGTITMSAKVGQRVQIAISDTGEGIDEKNLKKIFDPFFTTKDTTQGNTGTIKGTGLGLHLVYNYLKKMNGDIEVKSKVGTGTTFTITLDKAPSA